MRQVLVKLKRLKSTKIPIKIPNRKLKTSKLITHNWQNSEVLKLIEAVKVRPQLWHKEHKQHSSSKASISQMWDDVAKVLKNKEIDGNQVSLKWKYLRKQFVINTERKKKGKFTEKMLFLLEPIDGPSSIEVEKVPEYHPIEPEVVLSESNGLISLQNKDHSIDVNSTTQPLDEMSPSFIRRCIQSTELSSSVPTLEGLDPNSSFCEHLLSELYALSAVDSRRLRRLLLQVVYDFADAPED